MIESEALKKWCPFARSHDKVDLMCGNGEAVVSINRTMRGNPDYGCMCIGSKCMAWKKLPSSQIDGCGQTVDGGGYCTALQPPK